MAATSSFPRNHVCAPGLFCTCFAALFVGCAGVKKLPFPFGNSQGATHCSRNTDALRGGWGAPRAPVARAGAESYGNDRKNGGRRPYSGKGDRLAIFLRASRRKMENIRKLNDMQ